MLIVINSIKRDVLVLPVPLTPLNKIKAIEKQRSIRVHDFAKKYGLD